MKEEQILIREKNKKCKICKKRINGLRFSEIWVKDRVWRVHTGCVWTGVFQRRGGPSLFPELMSFWPIDGWIRWFGPDELAPFSAAPVPIFLCRAQHYERRLEKNRKTIWKTVGTIIIIGINMKISPANSFLRRAYKKTLRRTYKFSAAPPQRAAPFPNTNFIM